MMPICGMQVKNQLPNAPYYEISPAGHCPHDEVPEVLTNNVVFHARSLKCNEISSHLMFFEGCQLSCAWLD